MMFGYFDPEIYALPTCVAANRGGSRIYWLLEHSQKDQRSPAQGRTRRPAGGAWSILE